MSTALKDVKFNEHVLKGSTGCNGTVFLIEESDIVRSISGDEGASPSEMLFYDCANDEWHFIGRAECATYAKYVCGTVGHACSADYATCATCAYSAYSANTANTANSAGYASCAGFADNAGYAGCAAALNLGGSYGIRSVTAKSYGELGSSDYIVVLT